MITLTRRFSDQVFQVKQSPHSHYFMRQVYRGCSGVQRTKWQRVLKATVDQLGRECIKKTAPTGRPLPLHRRNPPEQRTAKPIICRVCETIYGA